MNPFDNVLNVAHIGYNGGFPRAFFDNFFRN